MLIIGLENTWLFLSSANVILLQMEIIFPELNDHQIEKLSDISAEKGILCMGSVVLPAVFGKFNSTIIGMGILLAFFFWSFSLWLRR